MLNFIITAVYELLISLQLTSVLEFMSIIVVIMLLGSPGAVATTLAVGTKLGIRAHVKERKADS